jgi:hypothetical protein
MVNEGKKIFQLFEDQFTMANLHQASLPAVMVEFYAITQGEKESVLAYTSRVDIIVATLAKLGEKVFTRAWIHALGNGLRPEFKECKDGILYTRTGFGSVMSVKTNLISEEAVLTSKNKTADDSIKAAKHKDGEIALKLKVSTDKKIKAPKEPDDSSLMITGKGGKGESKGKGRAKGQTTWNDASQWPTQWSSPAQHPTAPYSNWTPPAKGKGNGKVDPATLWCDIHQIPGHSTEWCFDNPYRTGVPPIPHSRTWWCDSCNSYNCWAKSPSPNTKGKGKPLAPKGKGYKGQQGDRKWKSPNFPAAYSTEQATPALHDESPSKSTTNDWWEEKDRER